MNPEIIFVIGILTALFGLLTKIVGFPDQIRQNYKRRSVEGVSSISILLLFLSYTFLTIHGLILSDWAVYSGSSLGIITTGIILWQMFVYRQK